MVEKTGQTDNHICIRQNMVEQSGRHIPNHSFMLSSKEGASGKMSTNRTKDYCITNYITDLVNSHADNEIIKGYIFLHNTTTFSLS